MPVINSAEQNNEAGSRFARRSFLLISSNLLKLFVQLGIIFLYSHELSVKEYGLYQSAWLYLNVISVIGLFGLPSLILSSSPGSILSWIKANRRYFIVMSTLLNVIPFAYILFSPGHYDTDTKLLIITLTIVQNASILAESIAIKNEKEALVLLSNIIFSAGYFICHYAILRYGYSLPQLLSWLLLVFVIKTLLLIAMNGPGENRINSTERQLGRQWLFLGLFDVISVLFKWLDKWLILFFISVTQFAIYFNGAYEIPVFAMILSAVGNIMVVELSRANNPDPARARQLFVNSSVLLASVVFPSFSFLFFYHTEFFTFFFSEKYLDSIPVFLVVIFVLPLRITNFTAVLQVYNRNDLVVKGALLDLLLAVILMSILYPWLDLQGLALAFVLSTYIQAAYYLWHTSRLLEKKVGYFFPFRRLIALMLISLILTGTGYYIFTSYADSNFIPGIILCILLIGSLLSWYFKTHKKLLAV